MTYSIGSAARILGSLSAVDGKGSVCIQDRIATDIDDLWSAFTEPQRLARWLGEIDGDLRPGGKFRAHFLATGWEGLGRVEVCEPPRRLLVRTTGSDEHDEHVIEATFTSDGDHTVLVVEERGMPLDHVAGYGAGVQVHVEDLAAYLAGQQRCDSGQRMVELYPLYQGLNHRLR